MIKYIIKKFVRNYQHPEDSQVRKSYGVLSGVLGIICNTLLFLLKLIAGLMINSIAVISDAFNNLTDSGSSIITIYGANFSSKPPDKEHPYGHGRFEYVASLIVSFIIFTVGVELLQTSFSKIMNPEEVGFDILSLVILIISVFIKIWMYGYNKYIGKIIDSSMNEATAKDSLNDAVATLGVIAGTIIGLYVDWPIDAVLGLVISFLIIYTGFSTAKDSVHFLLGPSPDPQILDHINEIVAESPVVSSCHDLMIHDYGPGRKVASMHVVVPPDISVEKAHYLIHDLEGKIKQDLGIDIVIHMDPEEGIDEKLNGNEIEQDLP